MSPRRTFFKQIAGVAASFAILPSATTYERIWKPALIEPIWTTNPCWSNATHEVWWLTADRQLIAGSFDDDFPKGWTRLKHPIRFKIENSSIWDAPGKPNA